ncbi:MAG: ABC transporter ATP-binding protein [Candidatus Flexifilum sp.]|jgi:ABC-type nitrate/sulfonate/bicarbonate transport system ATPase subunit
MAARIRIHDLHAAYPQPGRRDDGQLVVLAGIHLQVAAGEFVCLIGPSGSGKTTLIRLIAGLQKPTRGSIWLDDQIVLEPTPRVALMFQDANLMPWRTVMDNIALPLELKGVRSEERRARAKALLPRLGLEGFERAFPGQLSGGMAQRVALGRVLIQSPEVLLLDEPLGALDAITRNRVSDDLLSVWERERMTTLMVTHDVHEAIRLADRVIVLSPRPAVVAAQFAIPFERPRPRELQYTPEFGALAARIHAAMDASWAG